MLELGHSQVGDRDEVARGPEPPGSSLGLLQQPVHRLDKSVAAVLGHATHDGPLVVPQVPEAPAQAAKPAECDANCARYRPVRVSWAKLLKRVFDLELEHCPNCGGELKIIAAILQAPVIEKILTHLGLQARAPPRAPARGQALQAA
jgi:hypothetical protein